MNCATCNLNISNRGISSAIMVHMHVDDECVNAFLCTKCFKELGRYMNDSKKYYSPEEAQDVATAWIQDKIMIKELMNL